MDEKEFQRKVLFLLKINGWQTHHTFRSTEVNPKGFPDILAWKPSLGRMLFAELKSNTGRLTSEQKEVIAGLAQISTIETYVWYPKDWELIHEIIGVPFVPRIYPFRS